MTDVMPSLSVRQLDEETVAALRRRAAARGVSMEEEVRRILREAAVGELKPGDLMDRIFARSRAVRGGKQFDSPEYDEPPEPPIEFE